MRVKSWKTNKIPRSIKKMNLGYEDDFVVGDLVKGDFENEFVATFTRASEHHLSSLYGDGPLFYRHELGLVTDLVMTPDSFYSSGFCRILMGPDKIGWLPNRWLKRVDSE